MYVAWRWLHGQDQMRRYEIHAKKRRCALLYEHAVSPRLMYAGHQTHLVRLRCRAPLALSAIPPSVQFQLPRELARAVRPRSDVRESEDPKHEKLPEKSRG